MKIALLALAMAMAAGCSTQSPNQTENGAFAKGMSVTLEDWNIIGDANWRVNENIIEADSGAGFLVTPMHYDNFRLEVEFYAEENTNSGVFFRCNSETEISDQNCYEANIFDACPAEFAPCRTGALTKIAVPNVEINAEGHWNKYVIHADNKQIRILLNGIETVFVRDRRHSQGPIALQLKQGGIKFRNIKIGEVK